MAGCDLVQTHHTRLSRLGVGEGELGLGEHDEQPRGPDVVVTHVPQRLPGQAGHVAVLAVGKP